MKKLLALVLAPLLILGLFATPAIAATPKAGAKCSNFGESIVSSGKKFTCLMVGSKQVWNKGVKVSGSSPAPTSFQAQIPITLPVAQNGTVTFANAMDHISDIPKIAWQRVQDVIASNKAVEIPTTISIGPSTGTTKEQILPLLQKTYRLFQGFSQPSSYIGLVYNGKDQTWAEKQLGTLFKDLNDPGAVSNFSRVMREACDLSNAADPSCTGGNSLNLFPSTGGASLYGVQEPYWNSSNQSVGPMSQINHEYTHNVQFAQWIGAPRKSGMRSGTDEAHTKMPCWFQEGQANGIGIPVWAPDLQSYINARKGNVARGINSNLPKPSLTTFTAESFTKFLYEQDQMKCYNPSSGDYQLGYSVGYAAVEALVAIGGPQSTMALLTKMADGDDWSSAFLHVYGISWQQGSSVLGKILAAEYAVLPLGSNG